jgi:hypothetical protein
MFDFKRVKRFFGDFPEIVDQQKCTFWSRSFCIESTLISYRKSK